ncbi:ankyrin repeat-containing BDA1-like [Olea europaea subsp. europaea]|uniref:Ankyrin repeat-containing BDA1-like n=1 Tax=Olea europaea subsp. europaea TaxID=158383 RepID=A0A8S0RU49_OLEEU|nr:ankyrin repeat-containing BDA1-like [Olea europaea subsp. europaea]
MDRRLIEAAQKGDVHQLLNLIKDDQFLMRSVALSGPDNPLHIACMVGNLQFVKEVLNMRPEFTKELNHEGFSPLHMAAANGDTKIVKELLKIDSNLCMVKGKERRIPLHYAVIKGRTQVIEELLLACEDSIRELTARGETSFHLAVKNNQFEALKSLVVHHKTYNKEDNFNQKDAQGDTILHLAVSRKQYEAKLMLDENFVTKGMLEVNSLNKRGLTPLDVLISERGDFEIEEMLRLAGASGVENTNSGQWATQSDNRNVSTHEPSESEVGRERPRKPSKKLRDFFNYDKTIDTPNKVRHTLLVIAVLITTATYQAVLSTPGGVWQEDFSPTSNKTDTGDTRSSPPPHTAGRAVMGTHKLSSYGPFLFFNSIGFFMSIHMINFLTTKIPLRLELLISLLALISTYDTCMGAIAPNNTMSTFFTILSIVLPFLIPIMTRVTRDYFKRPRCVFPSTSASA